MLKLKNKLCATLLQVDHLPGVDIIGGAQAVEVHSVSTELFSFHFYLVIACVIETIVKFHGLSGNVRHDDIRPPGCISWP